ncbi:MAG TPA: hypothetical protein VII61_09800 [Ktedonobacteraceae bacterium]
MSIYPLDNDGKHALVEINGGFIQSLIEERDVALARNRELEAENERAVNDQLALALARRDAEQENAKLQEQISILATHNLELDLDLATCKVENRTLKMLVQDWQKLMQDWDDIALTAPQSAYEEWGVQWKKLVLCTDLLLKGEAHVE